MPGCRLHFLISQPWNGATSSGEIRLAAELLARQARGAPAHLLVFLFWHAPAILGQITEAVGDVARSAPNISVTIAAGTREDERMFRAAGLDAIWCHHNALIDERLFTPDPGAEKLYDAVNNGRLVPFKRHELAAGVSRLAIVSSAWEVEEAYALSCIAAFRDLRFVNYQRGVGVQELDAEGVRRVVTASCCGLALSAMEGGMYASAEYLLCGLPVVTTPSLGGRDEFFHPDYVETVAAEPAAVEAGVARFLAREPDPWEIRRRTLDLFRPHRARLLQWLSSIAGRDLFPLANESLWLPSYVDKLSTWRHEVPPSAP